jgi:hypothetical protein
MNIALAGTPHRRSLWWIQPRHVCDQTGGRLHVERQWVCPFSAHFTHEAVLS